MIPKPVLLALVFSLGCGASLEEHCTIDIDCKPGLVCSLTNECVNPKSPEATFPADHCKVDSDCKLGLVCSPAERCIQAPITTVPVTCGDCVDTQEPTEQCLEHRGVFLPQDTECLEPTSIYQVTKIELATDQTHGLSSLALLGNSILKDNLKSGDIKLEAWVDGTMADDCEWSIAWITEDTDRNPDCTPKYATGMPFMLPAFSSRPVLTVILDATLDPKTLRMTGHIDKSDFAEGLMDAYKTVADNLIEDVDTDSDGTPDKVSVILNLGLSNN